MSFSNLGVVVMPPECEKYIDRMEFANGSSIDSPINTTIVTYNNKSVITFSSCIIERNLQKAVINRLSNDEVKLIIETNDLEVEHEKMS
jgi:hypothetical protein